MKIPKLTVPVLMLLFCLSTLPIFAQTDTCPSIVTEAITITQNACGGVDRNQVCYGNLAVEAQFQEGAANLQFESTGDIVNLSDIASLSLSGDAPVENWGMALLSLQADLPDTLPGQNVTMLLFGNLGLENAGEQAAAALQILVQMESPVYEMPDAAAPITGNLLSGATAEVFGRNETGDWLQIRHPETAETGWIESANAISTVDLMSLAVVDENTGAATLQAFYLRGNSVNTDCAAAPEEGMYIQTPAGVGELSFMMNEVQITLGSTALVQAVPGETMTFHLDEGTARLTTQGVTVNVPEGATATIPLDENGAASGIPAVEGVETLWRDQELSRQVTCTGDNIIGPGVNRTRTRTIIDNAINGNPDFALVPGNTWVNNFEIDVVGDGSLIDTGEDFATVISPTQIFTERTMTRTASDGSVCELADSWTSTYIGQVPPEADE